MTFTSLSGKRLILALLAFVLSLSIAPQFSESALAARGCRADPQVWLSDGRKLKLVVDIDTPMSDVESVTYTIHAPAGTTLKRIGYNKGQLGRREKVLLFDDAVGPNYVIDTEVVNKRNANVVASGFAVNLGYDNRTTGSANGLTNVKVRYSIPKP